MNQRQITERLHDNTEEKQPAQAPAPQRMGFAVYSVVPHLLDHDVEKAVAKRFQVGAAECLEYKKTDIQPFNHSGLRQLQTQLSAIKQQWQQLNGKVTLFHRDISRHLKERAELKDESIVSLYPSRTGDSLFANLVSPAGKKSFITIDAQNDAFHANKEVKTYVTNYVKRKQTLNLFKYTKNKYNQLMLLVKICRYLPCTLKEFLALLEGLPAQDKRNFKGLLSDRYEVMFAYNGSEQDFIVSMRPRKCCMPHPTLIGGVDPTVLLGGTIDLTFIKNHLKITIIRGDSGHYQVGSHSLELIGWYIQKEINPVYFGNKGFIKLQSFCGDQGMTKALEIYPCSQVEEQGIKSRRPAA